MCGRAKKSGPNVPTKWFENPVRGTPYISEKEDTQMSEGLIFTYLR
jgi:hypothetical protein